MALTVEEKLSCLYRMIKKQDRDLRETNKFILELMDDIKEVRDIINKMEATGGEETSGADTTPSVGTTNNKIN